MRLLHVCADPVAGGRVADAARSASLAFHRFDDAFAAAAWLLDAPPAPTVLLLAVDGLAKVELGLCRWATGRGPVTVWVHGDRKRLNGQAGDVPVRAVELARLADLLGAWRDGAAPARPAIVAESPSETTGPAGPYNKVDTDEPDASAIDVELEARLQSLVDEPEIETKAEFSPEPSPAEEFPVPDPGDAVLTADELASLTEDNPDAANTEEVEDSPALRLHPAADQPDDSLVLTAAEIEALLGDDKEADRGQG